MCAYMKDLQGHDLGDNETGKKAQEDGDVDFA